ncbi:carbamoyl-phosphate synthase small subunit [Sphingobacteriales bacterium UPWRP_1]|nr:hypothetical protein BVG80_12170 [Sphingobacteriales bacterium TSM_CSM]PSJ75822.1 carbamoyl-phosphate synthase small subunit [Sphingobacteriales bacterium UPWRP_1]
MQARLIFEDGLTFYGTAFTQTQNTVFAELVFNTAMTGYEEIITDPSYRGQMVVMTYPMAGNYGFNASHTESNAACIEALVVKTYVDMPSVATGQTLKNYLDQHQIMGVENMDTRAIVQYLRNFGAKRAVLTAQNTPPNRLIETLKQWSMPVNLAETAGNTQPRVFAANSQPAHYRIAIIDTGAKLNIINMLQQQGCNCTLLPPNIPAAAVLSGNFNGILLANGPGDPHQLPQLVQTIRQLLGKIPVFGICLGHQLLGLALGLEVVKLKFGHHGANHPVKNLLTGKVEITSHNHNYAITLQSVQQCPQVQLTHLNLLDQTVAGIKHRTMPAFSVQYHPEAAPGPADSHYLFAEFVNLMNEWRNSQLGVT